MRVKEYDIAWKGVRMYVLVFVCVCVRVCACASMCMSVCIFISVYVRVYVYELISCTQVSTDDRQQPALLSRADTGYDLVRGYNLH